jgi:hypothetical protein
VRVVSRDFLPPLQLKHSHECHKVLLFTWIEIQFQHKVKELDHVFSVKQRLSCKYGGDSLIPRSGKVLIGPCVVIIMPSSIRGFFCSPSANIVVTLQF